jgi:plastocyanin
MKTRILLTVVLLCAFYGLKAQSSHTINESGFTFDPADLTIHTGETVEFSTGSSHPVQEVSEATWNDNGITPLEGGFSFNDGTGSVTFETPGVHYYVCVAHVASQGMKGKITVVLEDGLDELSVSGKYAVYPVPLKGSELIISSKSSAQEALEVSIYDLAGNLRVSSLGTFTDGKYPLDCSALPAGIFIMKLKTLDGSSYGKLVRE